MIAVFHCFFGQTSLAFVAIDSNSFTNFLGIVAVVAFCVTAIWIMFTLFRDAGKRNTVMAAQEQIQSSIAPPPPKDPQEIFDEEVKRIEEECTEFYDEAIKTAKAKLGELVLHSRSALRNISITYAKISRNPDNEHFDHLKAKFIKVCESQWSFFKNELGYISYNDIEPHIRMIFSSQTMADQVSKSHDDEDSEMSPSMSRVQEVLLLQNSIPSERMGAFQMEAMDAVEPFKRYYETCVKDWVNECLFNIVSKIREKGAKGASIKDTNLRERFVRLKNTIETMGRLADRLDSNMQEIGEQDAAYNQIIFGSVIMSILAHAPAWFPELGDSELDSSEDVAAAVKAAVEEAS